MRTNDAVQNEAGGRREWIAIVAATAAMLSLSMGIRQSLGLFMQPVTADIALTVSGFTLAIAVQNLMWGVLQPVAGALAERYGFRLVMTLGALAYVAGLLALATADGAFGVFVGAGVLIGAAMACTGMGLSLAVAATAASEARRSMTLGIVSAAGSLGAVVAAPLGQGLIEAVDWRAGALGFAAMAAAMPAAAWIAGRVDHRAAWRRPGRAVGAASSGRLDGVERGAALRQAMATPAFVVMATAYFVCGMQLVFLTTHLPSYLALCGLQPMLAAEAFGLIAIFNVFGSLFFGWAGGRWSKTGLLGLIYVSRSVVLLWFFLQAPTPTTTLVFAALMGFLWLGVGPLMAGAVAEMFGLRWQAMLGGIAFFGHQAGSFVGALGGGWIFERMGAYDVAWQLGVGVGLLAGATQIACALAWDPRARGRAAAA